MGREFSLEGGTLTLNSTPISGYSEDTDALAIPEITLANAIYGADGRLTVASTGTKGATVTIKLSSTSNSVKFLSGLAESQKNGNVIVFNGKYVNHNNGTSVALKNGTLTSYTPYPTLGKGSVSSMVYAITFERVDGNYSSADFGD